MLTGFSVRGFKSLADLPPDKDGLISFNPLNVLIGPNGSGKSSLLQSIDFLRAFFMSSVEVYLRDRDWSYKDLPNLRRTQKNIRWHLTAQLGPDEYGLGAGEYSYIVSLQPRKHLGVGEEILEWTPPSGQPCQLLHRNGREFSLFDKETQQHKSLEAIGLPASIMSQMDSKKDYAKYPEMLRFRSWIEQFRAYLIWDPKILRMIDRGKYEQIGLSGEHLAAVMGQLKDKQPDKFRKLVDRIRRLFPSVTNISVAGRGWG